MKNIYFIFLLILLFLSAGCIDDAVNSSSNQTNTAEISIPIEKQYDINLSAIPIDTPDLIQTNGSYIASIALQDKRAQELLKYGGKPVVIAVLFHSCPRNNPYCDQNPKLIIQYQNIRFAFTVDEQAGKLIGGTAMLPTTLDSDISKTLYHKTRDLSNHTDYVYYDNALIMIYNDTSFIYFNQSFPASEFSL